MPEIPWKEILQTIATLGIVRGIFVVFFFGAHLVVYLLYRANIKGKQGEINRLAADNKEYRERFTVLLDQKLHIPKSRLPTASKPKPPKKRRR